ncbi:hypothetical protein BS47DRAFT_1357802 [Hydnum rufescens UP504]|uniref:Uncharacterized protein n=1 Tax=Hydnum rufescens UP504 TaxID=1448309 RepID=A0A9P6BCB0_9AGAM|nr:hypothetical protein BS47DRAFT_1357802 [Hydnum rufescens UP504]
MLSQSLVVCSANLSACLNLAHAGIEFQHYPLPTYCGVVTRYYRHALQKDNDDDRDYDDDVITVTVADPTSYDPTQTRSVGDSGPRSTKEHTTPQQCWGVVIRDIIIDRARNGSPLIPLVQYQ